MARSLQVIPISTTAGAIASSQLQFSPSGNYLYLAGTAANYNFMARKNAQGTYVGVPAGQFSSIDWTDDETRVLTISMDGTALQLRSFNAATGVFGAVLSSVPTTATAVFHLGANLFAVIRATATGAFVWIVSVSGDSVSIITTRDYSNARIWSCDVHENEIYLRCGSTTAPRIDKLIVAANGSVTTETLANSGNARQISVSENGDLFITPSSTTVNDNRLGNTTPLAFRSANFNGKLMLQAAFIFNDTVIMCVTENNQRFFLDALTANRVDDIASPSMSQVFGNIKNFARFGDRFVWLTSGGGSPFVMIEENEPPVEATVSVVGLLSAPDVNAGVLQNTAFIAEGLMGDAFTRSDSGDMDFVAFGIMGDAILSLQNIGAQISTVGIMAAPEIIADSNEHSDLVAVAPMGNATVFISKPGVCKSPR